MGNTTSSTQAQHRIEQLQMQLQNEYSGLYIKLSKIGENAMQDETSSRVEKCAGVTIGGIILGIIVISFGQIFLGIAIGILGIAIGYSMRFSDVDKSRLNGAISTLNAALQQNPLMNNHYQNRGDRHNEPY